MSLQQEAVELSGEYTVPLQITKVLPNVEHGHGTAVMLRAFDMLFAFTAKHCHKTEDSVTFNNLKVRTRELPCLIAAPTPHPKLDIVRFTIENSIPAILACSLEQVDKALPIVQDGRSYWITGFPAYVSFDDNGFTGRGAHLPAKLRNADENNLSFTVDMTPDVPQGMSGGGVWFYRGTREAAFNPLDLRLVGIVSYWDERSRTINAVPSNVIHGLFQPDPVLQFISDLYK